MESRVKDDDVECILGHRKGVGAFNHMEIPYKSTWSLEAMSHSHLISIYESREEEEEEEE